VKQKTTGTKVEELLSKIDCNHPDVRSAVGVIRMTPEYQTDFALTVNKLSEAITQIFPGQQSRLRGRNVSTTGTRPHTQGRYFSRGSGRGFDRGRMGNQGRGRRAPGRAYGGRNSYNRNPRNMVNGIAMSVTLIGILLWLNGKHYQYLAEKI
jgi:hypothetical protein